MKKSILVAICFLYLFLISVLPSKAASANITNAGIRTDWNPWAGWVIGTGFSTDQKIRLVDTDGRAWGNDISVTPAATYGINQQSTTFRFPSNNPPSGCNMGKTCTITIYLVSSTGELSNGYSLDIPSYIPSIPIPKRDKYAVGVDYHATGTDFAATAFIQQYDKPEVRALVKSQLQGMADAGIKIISTRLFFMDPPEKRYPDHHDRLGFPPSDQDLANIRQYVQDVASIKTPDGGTLDLYLSPFGHGCASLVGLYCNYSWDQTISIYKETYTDFFNAIGDIKKPDGSPAVSIAYMEGEVRLPPDVTGIPATANMDKFLVEMYPFFINLARSKGIIPSIYFVVDHGTYYSAQSNPDLHLGWISHALSFLSGHGLPVPDRLDISFYVDPVNGEYSPTVDHIMQDIKTTFPGKRVGISETFYPKDQINRQKIGQAFVNASKKYGIPEEIIFWTTPLGTDAVSYPFDITSYLIPPEITGNLNNDSVVNIDDYNILKSDFGKSGSPGFKLSDINKNGKVDIFDYNTLVVNFGK